MPELVALDLPGGRGFVDALLAIWDTGDAAAPLDPRLPTAAARVLLETLRPTRLVGADGEISKVRGGLEVEDGDALVIATSGSTGAPRGVVLTHHAIASSAESTSRFLSVDPTRHRWLACLPLAHIGGLAVVLRAVLTGTPCTVLPGFDADTVERAALEGSATHVALVRTALARLDPAIFERILLGGGPPPAILPPNVVTTYGLTETGSGVVYDGRPLAGVEVAIGTGDPDQGAEGEVLLRGPQLLRVYRDGTDPRIHGPDGRGGWLPTGDGGRLSGDGTLEVDGRLADVVVTGGEKVWPSVVESRLAEHVDVAEVAIWKRPDPEWGERVIAWIVPADRTRAPSLEALRAHVAERLPPWCAPKELVVTDVLPRTASGKVRRRELV